MIVSTHNAACLTRSSLVSSACPFTHCARVCARSFRTSGMGDCPYEERVATSNGVFSSEFKHYIYDNIPLLYMYTLFVSHDLLASAGADMPSGSEHSSEAGILSRRVAQPMPLPLPTKRRRSVGGYEIHDFCDAMREYATKPVELKQSEDLRRLRHFSAERMKVAVMRERVELSSAVQAELCGVLRSIQTYADSGLAVPTFLSMKQQRLEKQVEDMEREICSQPVPPEPAPPVAATTSSFARPPSASTVQSEAHAGEEEASEVSEVFYSVDEDA